MTDINDIDEVKAKKSISALIQQVQMGRQETFKKRHSIHVSDERIYEQTIRQMRYILMKEPSKKKRTA